jgi:hypothetical protein
MSEAAAGLLPSVDEAMVDHFHEPAAVCAVQVAPLSIEA